MNPTQGSPPLSAATATLIRKHLPDGLPTPAIIESTRASLAGFYFPKTAQGVAPAGDPTVFQRYMSDGPAGVSQLLGRSRPRRQRPGLTQP